MKPVKKNNEQKAQIFPFESLILLQVFVSFIALLHAWTLQYKSPDGSTSFVKRISFTSEDPPWTPPGTFSTAILHLHHFGDWTLGIAYSLYSTPYSPNLDIPSVTPPLGLFIWSIFSIIGLKASYLIFCLLTLFIWIVIVKNFFNPKSHLEKLVILIFYVLLALPSINGFDRGAVHLFLMGLIGLSYIYYENNQKVIAAFLFIIAASFKPYLIFLSLFILRKNYGSKYKQLQSVFKLWISIFLINSILMYLYAPNLIEGIKDYLLATSQYSRSFIIPWVMDSQSFMGFVSKTIEGFSSSNQAETFLKNYLPWSFLPGIIILCLAIIISINKNVLPIIAAPVILSISSIIQPASMEYTLVWASLASIIILKELSTKTFSDLRRELNMLEIISIISMIASLIVVITPYFGLLIMPSGINRHLPGGYIYIPIIFISYISALGGLYFKRKSISK